MANRTVEGAPQWEPHDLQAHLQYAIELEFWTIPYYLSAMYSIKDPVSEAYRLIQSVVYQEMLHTQLVCNIANAFDFRPTFKAPEYGGAQIPHLKFSLDDPNPAQFFKPHSTEIGPLDEQRINTMALIEYPEWKTRRQPDVQPDCTQYGSIGEFYDAIRVGVTELRHLIRGGAHQVDFFGSFYNHLPSTTITKYGEEGYQQAISLIDVIVEQGEGQTRGDADIPVEFQNTADGYQVSWPHFRKFISIRDSQPFPETFKPDPQPSHAGQLAQNILCDDFSAFLRILNRLFNGEPSLEFGALMAKLGGDILTCWQHGAVPKFS